MSCYFLLLLLLLLLRGLYIKASYQQVVLCHETFMFGSHSHAASVEEAFTLIIEGNSSGDQKGGSRPLCDDADPIFLRPPPF